MRIFVPSELTAQAADTEFGDKLEPPSSDSEVVSVAAVGIAVIEDREDRFRGLVDDGVVGDIDPLVCVESKDLCPLSIKGSITDSR